uniref:Uncharacterized protein n=1 Tax=Trichuris muris TaxID=70415 RepID=A0A5S6Q6A3_TRIMR
MKRNCPEVQDKLKRLIDGKHDMSSTLFSAHEVACADQRNYCISGEMHRPLSGWANGRGDWNWKRSAKLRTS